VRKTCVMLIRRLGVVSACATVPTGPSAMVLPRAGHAGMGDAFDKAIGFQPPGLCGLTWLTSIQGAAAIMVHWQCRGPCETIKQASGLCPERSVIGDDRGDRPLPSVSRYVTRDHVS
jgi:hypothetical protein